MKCATLFCGTIAAIAGSVSSVNGQPWVILWFTVDGGGAMRSAGGDFELSGTIGQTDAGVMTGGDFVLEGGFWPGAATGISPPGDCDGNGLVNLDDLEGMATCMAGPQLSVDPACYCADLDGDLDVDLVDFAMLAVILSGG